MKKIKGTLPPLLITNRKNGVSLANCFDNNNTTSFNDNQYESTMYQNTLGLDKLYSYDWMNSDHFYIQNLEESQLDISSNYFDYLLSIDDNAEVEEDEKE